MIFSCDHCIFPNTFGLCSDFRSLIGVYGQSDISYRSWPIYQASQWAKKNWTSLMHYPRNSHFPEASSHSVPMAGITAGKTWARKNRTLTHSLVAEPWAAAQNAVRYVMLSVTIFCCTPHSHSAQNSHNVVLLQISYIVERYLVGVCF